MIVRQLVVSFSMVLILTVLTGVVYPLLITGIAQLAFPEQANGSLIREDGRAVGSRLIGQSFSNPRYFWGRVSATSPFPCNAGSSTGSNYGPTNPALLESVQRRVAELKHADSLNTRPIPADLVTSSGSGLDPHISVAAAGYQIPRIARARGMREEEVRVLVDRCTEGRQWGVLGEPRVNVLLLNLALDATGVNAQETQ